MFFDFRLIAGSVLDLKYKYFPLMPKHRIGLRETYKYYLL